MIKMHFTDDVTIQLDLVLSHYLHVHHTQILPAIARAPEIALIALRTLRARGARTRCDPPPNTSVQLLETRCELSSAQTSEYRFLYINDLVMSDMLKFESDRDSSFQWDD